FAPVQQRNDTMYTHADFRLPTSFGHIDRRSESAQKSHGKLHPRSHVFPAPPRQLTSAGPAPAGPSICERPAHASAPDVTVSHVILSSLADRNILAEHDSNRCSGNPQ